MSGQFSTYLETALLNHVFVGPVYPQPMAIFIAVFSTAPDQSGNGGVEISDPGYGRFSITFGAPTGTPPQTQNNMAIQWAPATQEWNAVACGLYDSPTFVGNYLGGGHIIDPVSGAWAPKTLNPGDVFRIPVGGLSIGFWTAAQPAAPASAPHMRVVSRVGPIVGDVLRAAPSMPETLRMPGQAPRFPAPLPILRPPGTSQ